MKTLGWVLVLFMAFSVPFIVDAQDAPQSAATVVAKPVRGEQLQIGSVERPPPPVGLWGKPFAPGGLSRCDEMHWYRAQAGLPVWFDGIGFRESSCRNDVTSRTGCCHGYWQISVLLHLRDHDLGWRYRERCLIFQVSDVLGNTPLQKQKNACAAVQLLEVQGRSAWDV
jgi:hypothetical protein